MELSLMIDQLKIFGVPRHQQTAKNYHFRDWQTFTDGWFRSLQPRCSHSKTYGVNKPTQQVLSEYQRRALLKTSRAKLLPGEKSDCDHRCFRADSRGVLSEDGHPVFYVSRKLSSAERNYSNWDWEALAIVFVTTEKFLTGAQVHSKNR